MHSAAEEPEYYKGDQKQQRFKKSPGDRADSQDHDGAENCIEYDRQGKHQNIHRSGLTIILLNEGGNFD